MKQSIMEQAIARPSGWTPFARPFVTSAFRRGLGHPACRAARRMLSRGVRMRWTSHYIPIQFWPDAANAGRAANRQSRRRRQRAAFAIGAAALALACAAADSDLVRLVSVLALLGTIGPLWRADRRRLDRLESALGHMWQGLAQYDAEERLVLYNEQLAGILGLPPAALQGVATYRDLLARLVEAGQLSGRTVEEMWQENRALIAQGRPALFYSDLADGRMIAVSHQPLPDGGWVRTFADVTGRRRAEAQVIHMARHDPLTDLANRLLFRERLEQALQAAPSGVALMCLDLDGFKAVNDTLGHPAGDALLQQVASRLRQGTDEGDTVARLGGDEFAIVHPCSAGAEEALALALRLAGSIGAPYDIDGRRIGVQSCIGIALAPQHGRDANLLIRNADMALYHAKSAGRGAARLFEPAMGAQIERRQSMELDLREALALGQFRLEYQPIVNLRTWRVDAFEALLRWTHPLRGQIGPDEFVPVADKIGLTGVLGEWVLREACLEAATLPAEIGIAVNLSPLQVRGELMVAAVMEALAAARLAPQRLELEITEQVMLEDNATTRSVLEQLDALGVRVSMDDFGTGYSSLGALYRYPFDTVKIDRSFVRDLATRPDALAVLRAVVQLGAKLDIRTTVEGVETPEHLAKVLAEDCDCAQGYLFSRPLRPDEIPAFLRGWRNKATVLATLPESDPADEVVALDSI